MLIKMLADHFDKKEQAIDDYIYSEDSTNTGAFFRGADLGWRVGLADGVLVAGAVVVVAGVVGATIDIVNHIKGDN